MKNYKKIISFLSFLFAAVLVFNFPAHASDLHTHEQEFALASSTESVQKFNDYISTLPEDTAKLILEDEELVLMMTSDAYWTPSETNKVRSTYAVSLPLSNYPSGTYFTHNGNACSTCHNNNCGYTIPSGESTSRCWDSVLNSSGNCKRYAPTGAIQCKAFADYVFYQYTGENVSNSNKSDTSAYATIINGSDGADDLKTLFTSLPIGSNVRLKVRGQTYYHSIIISAKSSTGVTIYDANRIGKCKVGNQTKAWAQLASMYSGVVCAWTP